MTSNVLDEREYIPLQRRIAAFPGIPKYFFLLAPQDTAQEIALIGVEYPSLTTAARKRLVRYRLRALRHEILGRYVTPKPRVPASIRPSKLASATGYRTSSDAHVSARRKVSATRRAEIARKGAQARWNRDAISSSN